MCQFYGITVLLVFHLKQQTDPQLLCVVRAQLRSLTETSREPQANLKNLTNLKLKGKLAEVGGAEVICTRWGSARVVLSIVQSLQSNLSQGKNVMFYTTLGLACG